MTGAHQGGVRYPFETAPTITSANIESLVTANKKDTVRNNLTKISDEGESQWTFPAANLFGVKEFDFVTQFQIDRTYTNSRHEST